jgi:hypothetical protein
VRRTWRICCTSQGATLSAHLSRKDLPHLRAAGPVGQLLPQGWSGAMVEDLRLRPVRREDVLSFVADPEGRSIKVVLEVDGAAFRETWLSAVEAAAR